MRPRHRVLPAYPDRAKLLCAIETRESRFQVLNIEKSSSVEFRAMPTISPRLFIALGKLNDPPKVPTSMMLPLFQATVTRSGVPVNGSICPLSAKPVMKPVSVIHKAALLLPSGSVPRSCEASMPMAECVNG